MPELQPVVPIRAVPPEWRTSPAPPRPRAVLLSEDQKGLGGAPQLFSYIDAKDRDLLLRNARRKVVFRGKTLFTQGDPHDGIWLIESGAFRVFYSAPTGREITLAYWQQGNFIGGPEIFGGGTHMWSAAATRNSAVLHFGGRELRAQAERMPGLALALIDGLVFKGKCYSAMAQMLGTRAVSQRLKGLLRNLVELHGVREGDRIVIGASFSQQDLANMVGATRQWITVSLKKLQDEGIVAVGRGRIAILRPECLAE